MVSKIGFFTPVRGEAFDDYFNIGLGARYRVTGSTGTRSNVIQEKNKVNLGLTVLKIITYATGIIPLVMLIGKAIARSKCEYVIETPTSTKPVPKPLKSSGVWAGFSPRPEPSNGVLNTPLVWGGFKERKEPVVKIEDDAVSIEDAVSIQSILQAKKAQADLKAQKEAAVSIQSILRAKKAQDDLKAQKEAIVFAQSVFRGFKARNEFKVVKAEKEATQKVEEIARISQEAAAKLATPKLIGAKLCTLKALHELVTTEKSHLENIRKHLEVMSHLEFKKCLRKLEDAREFDEFCDLYKSYKGKIEQTVARMEAVADYFKSLKTENEFLKQRSLEDVKEDITKMHALFVGAEFEDYMGDQIKITERGTRFDAMVDLEKVKLTLPTLDKGLSFAIFSPCLTAGAQRLMRYKLTLKEARENFSKIGEELGEKSREFLKLDGTLRLLPEAEEKISAMSMKCNRIMDIQALKRILHNQKAASETTAGFFERLTGSQAAGKKMAQDAIEAYVEKQGLLNRKPEPLDLSATVTVNHQLDLQKELVGIAIIKEEKRVSELLGKSQLTGDDIGELKVLDQKIQNTYAWVGNPLKAESLKDLAGQIFIKLHNDRLVELTRKIGLSAEEREELRSLGAQFKVIRTYTQVEVDPLTSSYFSNDSI